MTGQPSQIKNKMDDRLSSVGAFAILISFAFPLIGLMAGFGFHLFKWAAGWGW